MDKQIVVALDGSPRAEAVLAPVIPLAHAMSSGLTLLQVLTSNVHVDPLVGMRLPPDDSLLQQEQEREAAVEYLDDMAHRFARPGWPVQTAILEGAPATAILDYASQHPEVGMIAMTTHGRRGMRRWVLGSVAEEVLHGAAVPVLLLRLPAGALLEGPEPGFKTIVVPVDQSSFAEAALAHATALARATGARLVLETAVPHLDLVETDSDPIPPWRQRDCQAEIDRLVLYQERVASQLTQDGVLAGMHIGDGRPADVILELAAEVKADLIVMATHGRTGFGRLRLGSVALEVAERATRPVLLLRVPAAPAEAAPLPGIAAGAVGAAGGHRG